MGNEKVKQGRGEMSLDGLEKKLTEAIARGELDETEARRIYREAEEYERERAEQEGYDNYNEEWGEAK